MFEYILVVFSLSTCCLVAESASLNADSYKNMNALTRTWDEAVALATAFAKQLTLEEKCNMTSGVHGPCVGTVTPIPRLNFTGLCFKDSPSGVGNHVPFSTAFVAGIQIAATWDRDLFYHRAAAIAQEFRAKGANYALGPMINIDRNALHGRDWEGFGADPYLSGQNAYYFVQGVQDQGVVATAKHYICNEQESNRTYYPSSGPSQGYSANLDDKTMHEIYLWPFADSVAAGAGSVMCSYNQVNGTQACENNKTLNGLLKDELGFRGNVMSDWGATKTSIPSVLGGLDINMPGDHLMGYSLVEAVKNGSVSESRIDDMVIRILAPYYLLGQDQNFPSVNLSYDGMRDHYVINRELGLAGIVLLKNVNNTLPFNANTQKFYSIYGSAASRQKGDVDIRGIPEIEGALYQGGGSGFVRSTYFIDPLSAILTKARNDHLQVQYVLDQNDYNAINRSLQDGTFINGHYIVFVNAWSAEGADRKNLSAYNDGDKLVNLVANHSRSVIVVVNSVAQLNLEAWIEHPHVTAVVWAGIPGSEYGNALVDVLFGNYTPGGKLVFTLAKNDSDYGTNITTDSYNSNYTEGVFLDYRHFDKYNITPRFYFGYGLSYTTFSFSSLLISKAGKGKHVEQSFYRKPRLTSYMNQGLSSFYEPVYTITFTVQNTGNVDGSEVAQLYLNFPEEAAEPPKILRGFERVYLEADESKTITLALTQRDISYWNIVDQKWTVAKGKYTVYISTSADNADIKLQDSFNI